MKTRVDVPSDNPLAPLPVISKLALAAASVTTDRGVASGDAQVEELAYKLYEERGRTDGNDQQDWFEAESILRERGKSAS